MQTFEAADYVIIGAGSAGCVLAARLSEDPAVRVVLLEAGGRDDSALIHCPAGLAVMARSSLDVNWRFETVPQPGLGGRRGYQPRGKVLGGSSSINAMIYLRGQPADYDGWAQASGDAGWSFDAVLPYFRRAEHNTRGADALHATGGPLQVQDLSCPNPVAARFIEAARQAGLPANPDFNGPTQEGVGWYQVTHRGGERCSSAKAYLGLAAGRPNLQVITHAQASRIVFDGRRASGVEFRHGRVASSIEARREVLVCAGALQTPQLLMLSGIGPGPQLQNFGIAPVQLLPGVGQNLHDHLDVVLVVDVPGLLDSFGLSLRGAWRTLGDLRQWRRDRSGRLTTNFAEAGAFLRSRPGLAAPDLQLHFVIGKLINHGRTTSFGHGYSVHVCGLQPESRGSVTLAGADPFAAPLIDPGFLQDERDLHTLVSGVQQLRRILAAPALAALGGRELQTSAAAQDAEGIARFIRQYADTIYHPVGSCAMGRNPESGAVVDAQLRIFGVQGLRVVDASVMPRITSGNTNSPTIMIGERAADLIRRAA